MQISSMLKQVAIKLHLKEVVRSQDSSVSSVTGYGMDGQSLIPGRGRNFSLLNSVQAGSGVCLASHLIGMGRQPDHTSI